MKEHIITYLLKNAQWWSGLNITNYGLIPSPVYFEYFGNNGVRIATEELTLAERCSKVWVNTQVAEGWARALTGDNVSMIEFFGTGASAQAVSIQSRDVIVKNIALPSMVKTLIRPSSVLDDLCSCKYLNKEFMDILEHISRWLDFKYPLRVARKAEVIDASPPSDTDCPEHPAGSHRFGDAIDVHYFTHAATNHTQRGTPLISIWSNGVLNNMFDRERNTDFMLEFLRLFPKGRVSVDTRIKDTIATTAWLMYDNEARETIISRVQGDAPEQYFHHLHMHCNYTGDSGGAVVQGGINWEAII
jgi:hypothetical protein